MKNSSKYSFSNGILEGINCKIKALKRVAYRYKNFFHFRNRILIQGNILTAK
ncbi:transposase [Fusobacterium sp.]|uniref:transposase n=1 Tax=Fusobacterium sp. TaxID=68766 RepID=UPI00343C3859